MKLQTIIEITDAGELICAAHADGVDAYGNAKANLLVIGALEVAKASLLDRRWGLNVGNFDDLEPLVKEPPVKKRRVKSANSKTPNAKVEADAPLGAVAPRTTGYACDNNGE